MRLTLLGFIHTDPATPTIFGGITGDICLRHDLSRDIIFLIDQRNTRTGAYAVQTVFPPELILVDGVDNTA